VVFSPDGSRIASASEDKTIKLWDPHTGQEIFTLYGHTAVIRCLAFSRDGHRIASGSEDWTVKVWDATPLLPEHLRRPMKVEPLAEEPSPFERAQQLIRRGQLHARRQGEWKRAADEYAEALELDPSDHWHWYQSAALQLQAGAVERYRQHCREMLRRFGETEDAGITERVAKTCLLAPGGPEAAALPGQLAERSYGRDPNNEWFLLVKGLADYRAGRYEAALGALDRGVARAGDAHCKASSELVRSMVCARLGRADEARGSFQQATRIMAEKLPKEGSGDLGGGWHDWLHCQILRREAEAALALPGGELPREVFAPARPDRS
jgi:tetratricopeptide (TPR) repeat protein